MTEIGRSNLKNPTICYFQKTNFKAVDKYLESGRMKKDFLCK